jgi:NAD(P)-dependent dehydrogenase (short-subunit alcohol dehydrogenase family)
MTQGVWDEVLKVNLGGWYNVTRTVIPQMRELGWGRIINVVSTSGLHGNFGQTNYSASKAAIIGATKSLARELASRGVTVNAVAPSFIETDLTKDLYQAGFDFDYVRKMTPLERLGKPEEVAGAICFFAMPEASYITGQVLAVDGGMYM